MFFIVVFYLTEEHMKKILSSIAIIVIALYGGRAKADQILYSCPAGCFCINNGKYDASYGMHEELCTMSAQHMPSYCENGRSFWTYRNGLLACPGITSQQANYYMDDFSELYKGYYGYYGFIGNDLILMPSNENVQGRYQCPATHPMSEKGAKTIFECYKHTNNGQKEYYTVRTNTQNNYSGNYDINNINTIIQNLQSALNQANAAAQNLQIALNSSNLTNTTLSQTATSLNNTNTIVSANDLKSKTNTQTTNQNTTGTTESTSDNTQSSTNKKFDFGSMLSSPFSTTAKVAKTVPTRSATPQRTARSTKTITPTVKHVYKNTQQTRPAQTKTRKSTPNPRQQGNI